MGAAMKDAKYWIERLGLEPHLEGGSFRQTYRSELAIVPEASADPHPVPRKGGGTRLGQPREIHPVANSSTRVRQPETRAASTAIYFLLEGESFSAFHRLKSDEMWHFYAGSPLLLHVIPSQGVYSSILLGNDLEARQVFQAVVPARCWFAAHVQDWKGWALVGCTVAPEFEFEDFELGRRDELVREYPLCRELIERLTRK